MNLLEIILISIGLAMDAFAVSICKGLSMKKMNLKKTIIIGIYFGFFQMMMPFIGYFLGANFAKAAENIDHWIAFILLALIGTNMIRESFSKKEEMDDSIKVKEMLILAIATSIDALAVGITYVFLDVKNIIFSFGMIGIITFLLSILGVKIGNKYGDKFENKAEFAGGVILLIIGIKILLEHMGILW